MLLDQIVGDIAAAMRRIDERRPCAANARTGQRYQPGIGPFPESQAVALVARELEALRPAAYGGRVTTDVPYPGQSRQRCDLCLGPAPDFEWCVEVKMLRLMGDNGKPNDNMLMHILSPYPQDRSAVTDCAKLAGSGLPGRKAIVIYGFDYPERPMDPEIDAFEVLARRTVSLGDRISAAYDGLVHPVHCAGRIFGWEVGAA